MIPAELNEAWYGTLMVLFALMALFSSLHLLFVIQRGRKQGLPLRIIYWTNKPAIAIFNLSLSLFMREGLVWIINFWKHHHLAPVAWISVMILPMFFFINGYIAVSVTCWIRNIAPFEITNLEWMIIIVATATFSIYMAV
jgi:hypothetical protein